MLIDPMMLASVRMEKNASKDGVFIPKDLGEVVYALATNNPSWTFECFLGFTNIEKIHVWCDGQRIGVLGRNYSSRAGCQVVTVASDNITARRGVISTSDTKKAIREAKRFFIPKTLTKLMDDRFKEAKDVLSTQAYKKNSRMEDKIRASRAHMQEFAMNHKRGDFDLYLGLTHEGRNILEGLKQAEELQQETKVLDDIKSCKNLILISRDKGKYVVKTLDNVQTYDDNSIPEEYRGKLGMLKLIEDKQCIANIGCKVAEDLFLLIGN